MAQRRYERLVKKSAQAATVAIEIYNKPRFDSREDIFCILITQAWELLLKARILHENEDSERSIAAVNKGAVSQNRSGNTKTISLSKCIGIVRQYKSRNINDDCISNIHAVMEIRDNAVHYFNDDKVVNSKISELGLASIFNFFSAIRSWFGVDLEEFGFIPLPISFYPPEYMLSLSDPIDRPKATVKLLKFLNQVDAEGGDRSASPFYTRLQLRVELSKGNTSEGLAVRVTKDPHAPEIRLT